jgi:hypothetical protein
LTSLRLQSRKTARGDSKDGDEGFTLSKGRVRKGDSDRKGMNGDGGEGKGDGADVATLTVRTPTT